MNRRKSDRGISVRLQGSLPYHDFWRSRFYERRRVLGCVRSGRRPRRTRSASPGQHCRRNLPQTIHVYERTVYLANISIGLVMATTQTLSYMYMHAQKRRRRRWRPLRRWRLRLRKKDRRTFILVETERSELIAAENHLQKLVVDDVLPDGDHQTPSFL